MKKTIAVLFILSILASLCQAADSRTVTPVASSGTILPEHKLQEGGLYTIEELKQNQAYGEFRFETNAYFYKSPCPPCPPGYKCEPCAYIIVLSDKPLEKNQLPPQGNGHGIYRASFGDEASKLVSGQRYHFALTVMRTGTSQTGQPHNYFKIISFEKIGAAQTGARPATLHRRASTFSVESQ